MADNQEAWRDRIIEIKSPEDLPPPHDEKACGKCQYVANGDSIVVHHRLIDTAASASGSLRKRERSIVELGRFTLPRWPGCAMWYLFQCPDCDALNRDYLHGYELYLKCSICEFRWYVEHKRFYAEAGVQKRPGPWTALLEIWRFRGRLGRVGQVNINPDGEV
jgi:hypothetical protein